MPAVLGVAYSRSEPAGVAYSRSEPAGVVGGGGPGHDLLHHRALGVGVVLHVPPGAPGQLPLGPLVPVPVGVAAAKPVAEQQHPVHLGAAVAENVQVHVGVRTLENAVLEPVRLPDPQHVAGRLQRGQVRRLGGGVRHRQHDVDARLGGQPGYRRGAGVLDQQRRRAERAADTLLLPGEQGGPSGVVPDQLDRCVGRRQLADHVPAQLVVAGELQATLTGGHDAATPSAGGPQFPRPVPARLNTAQAAATAVTAYQFRPGTETARDRSYSSPAVSVPTMLPKLRKKCIAPIARASRPPGIFSATHRSKDGVNRMSPRTTTKQPITTQAAVRPAPNSRYASAIAANATAITWPGWKCLIMKRNAGYCRANRLIPVIQNGTDVGHSLTNASMCSGMPTRKLIDSIQNTLDRMKYRLPPPTCSPFSTATLNSGVRPRGGGAGAICGAVPAGSRNRAARQ